MALPYTSLIESLEREVEKGTFSAWAFANPDGIWSCHFADEACPPDWILDENHQDHEENRTTRGWFPAFDLASLSKPLLANVWLRHTLGTSPIPFAETQLASLIEPRSDEGTLLKNWAGQRPWLTLAHLLNHTSGLKPWCWFGRALWNFGSAGDSPRTTGRLTDITNDTEGIIARRAQFNLTQHILNSAPRESTGKTAYSDLNYFLLARVIENLSFEGFKGWQNCLDILNEKFTTSFWHASLDPERGLNAIPFFPYVHSQVVAHIYENRKLENHVGHFGSVHDTNANILASEFKAASKSAPLISSHAGLFGSIQDVRNALPFLIETQRELTASARAHPAESERFLWGLDTPSSALSTAGLNHWPLKNPRAIFGHLGYSGTSLWMADDGQFHVLLTNRTAHRSTLGAQSAPRILLFQEKSESTPQCRIRFARGKNSSHLSLSEEAWQSIPTHDAYTLCFEQHRLNTRYWNRHLLRAPPDLAELRRKTGQLLWTH